MPLLIDALTHEEYRVSICALSALCNLSATPACLSRFAANTELLGALERILMQKRVDPDPQAHAAQLLLNLTAQFSFKLVDDMNELALLSHAHDPAAAAMHANVKVKPAPLQDTDPSTSSREVHTSPAHATTAGTTGDSQQGGRDGRPPVAADPRALLATSLTVLRSASALHVEARENCIEVVLALLQLPGSFLSPDPAVRAPPAVVVVGTAGPRAKSTCIAY